MKCSIAHVTRHGCGDLVRPRNPHPSHMPAEDYFLYAATAYFGLNAAIFSCAPGIPATDSFGEEEAKKNKPMLIMSELTGAMMALSGVTTAMLATGKDAKTAVTAGLCVMPARMVYDYTVNKTTPPAPVIAQTLGIVAFGAWTATK